MSSGSEQHYRHAHTGHSAKQSLYYLQAFFDSTHNHHGPGSACTLQLLTADRLKIEYLYGRKASFITQCPLLGLS